MLYTCFHFFAFKNYNIEVAMSATSMPTTMLSRSYILVLTFPLVKIVMWKR